MPSCHSADGYTVDYLVRESRLITGKTGVKVGNNEGSADLQVRCRVCLNEVLGGCEGRKRREWEGGWVCLCGCLSVHISVWRIEKSGGGVAEEGMWRGELHGQILR